MVLVIWRTHVLPCFQLSLCSWNFGKPVSFVLHFIMRQLCSMSLKHPQRGCLLSGILVPGWITFLYLGGPCKKLKHQVAQSFPQKTSQMCGNSSRRSDEWLSKPGDKDAGNLKRLLKQSHLNTCRTSAEFFGKIISLKCSLNSPRWAVLPQTLVSHPAVPCRCF